MDPVDPADLRISHDDREKIAELLRQAAGEGRIDLDELDERLEAAYAAKTYRDLVPITLDLPGHGATTVQPVPPSAPSLRKDAAPVRRTPPGVPPTHTTSVAMMSETRRRGGWDVGPQHTAVAVMGSVVIDLREARFPAEEVVITANAVMGSIEIIVDAETAVRVTGVGIMGTFDGPGGKAAAEPHDSSPVVRVNGLALMGSVEVKRKGPPGELGRRVRKHLGG